jgi:Penicillinase repressor.
MEADPINRALGSVGLLGATDTIIILDRKRGETKGKLLCTSRYAQEIELALEFEMGIWTVLGNAREVEIAEEQRKILETIQALGGKATPKEIAEALGKNYGTVKTHLFRMLQKGLVKKEQGGIYSVCNNVNPVNSVNHVTLVNPVNPPRVTSRKLGCKPSKPAQNLGLDDTVYTVYTVYTNDQNDISTTPQPQTWRVRVKNTPCKCGCNEWKVRVDPHENEEALVFGECLNCGFERTIDLRDYEIIQETPDEDIPF